jgi:hypothetical protein
MPNARVLASSKRGNNDLIVIVIESAGAVATFKRAFDDRFAGVRLKAPKAKGSQK